MSHLNQKIWCLTKNHQILNLLTFKNFWVEEVEDSFKLFGKDDDEIEWNLGDYESFLDARNALNACWELLVRFEQEIN